MKKFMRRHKNQSFTAYAHFNLNNPLVAWEVAIGRISTFPRNMPRPSLWHYNLIKGYAERTEFNKIFREWRLEQVRQHISPHSVSRMEGVYFFKDLETARYACDEWRWNKEFVSKVEFYPIQRSEHDAMWITDDYDDISWMKSYWKKEIKFFKPMTEIIAKGIGKVLDEDFPMEAAQKICVDYPDSLHYLLSGMVGFNTFNIKDCAQITPYIGYHRNVIDGAFFMNIGSIEKHVDKIALHVNKALLYGKKHGEKIPEDMKTPDLRKGFFSVSTDEFYKKCYNYFTKKQ